ncbi:MAG: hypothetical protein EB059_03965 [Alphaproteobacteria bacterium]|nr:hypothetical protein [Alphaproteobacteria bacterium]
MWGEQAVGEEILYASMIDDAAALCGSDVMVECDARLKPLFERSLNGMTSVARTEPPAIGEIAAQCSAGQLGHYVRKNFSEFPQRTAYLKADADKTAQLRARYTAMKEALGKSGRIIGISWKSKPLRQGDPKSTTLADWAMIFEHSPHLFVSLQHGDCAEDFALAAQKNWALIDDKDVNQHASLDDFAAQVCAMDQVITVSNTTAHMAGACGVQTAVLVVQSRGLMWHWFDKVGFDKVGFDKVGDQTLTTSPWYPSVRLLRQSIDGVWDDVIRAAAAFLK